MRTTLTRESLAKAFAQELATAMLARTGGQRAPQPAENWRETGWHGAIAVTGEAVGSVGIWIEDTQALIDAVQLVEQAAVSAADQGEGAPASDMPPVDTDTLLRDLIAQAARATARLQPFRGLEFGDITIGANAVSSPPISTMRTPAILRRAWKPRSMWRRTSGSKPCSTSRSPWWRVSARP